MRRGSHKLSRRLFLLLLYAVLTAGAVVMVAPFLWMVSTSLKAPHETFMLPPIWIPEDFRFENYAEVFDRLPFFRFLLNTATIAGLVTFGVLLSCSLTAFALSRLRFRGRDLVFYILLATMIIPAPVTLVPIFAIMRRLEWTNTFLPLVVPAFFGGAFPVFLLRQFFMRIPRDLDEAAVMDGCSAFGIYWRVILPLGKPALATIGLISFMGAWNDFFGPLIYLYSIKKQTLTLGLATFQGYYATDWHLLMAATVIVTLPILLAFLFSQRFFVEGITMTGIKG
ncbi:MAG TPA: carbohydrate ABC transporter permease [Candidatus Sumerlaeota bacterium]|nr:MAG: L-arabinose transport system permease protein AraQ [candidate division BRC1 bacterium ADurb.BinA292]HOE96360.1 carbohydrate ABC transporter permease [Candidatus Sumerlaeota bacterium]HOR28452.1 carbohydrate ABC transporter permease [Candidatus Sumerlaeota bacterium]HPK01613.1 carbohydrate ABC transporter permease [Candidatus Sumerlaeota bacterium]